MDGESSEENIKRIRVARRGSLELLHRREHLQKERKDEKNPILEFLEGCICWVVNTISEGGVYTTWICNCSDI